MGCHAEFLRIAQQDDQLARAVMADPHAVADRAADPTMRELARLARAVTLAPWTLSPADRERAHAAGLDDAMLLHAVMLSSYFGHLNRIADAVGIALDYEVLIPPLHAEAATPPYLCAPRESWPDPQAPRVIDIGQRPGAAEALALWRAHMLDREAPLDRRQRALISSAVAERLGDARVPASMASSALDEALVSMADEVTLAPWRLGAATVERLRAAGLRDDTAIFDALSTATSATTFSRIDVALSALASVR